MKMDNGDFDTVHDCVLDTFKHIIWAIKRRVTPQEFLRMAEIKSEQRISSTEENY